VWVDGERFLTGEFFNHFHADRHRHGTPLHPWQAGLWPGWGWRGISGIEQAMRAMAYLQLDSLQIIARSHNIKLHSHVLEYASGMWEVLACQQRTLALQDFLG
jgi:hypothetical protein